MNLYETPRKGTSDPKGRGGNRRPRSKRTTNVMSYQGVDRGFILRFLNQGTKERCIEHLTEIKRASGGSKFRWSNDNGEYGKRGKITARNWFRGASLRELEIISYDIQHIIDEVINEEFV
jgi:hypothetical protein